MLLVNKKITREIATNMINRSFDSVYKNHPDQLKERYILLGNEYTQGFTCIEGNTNGWYILGEEAGLYNALAFLVGKL